MARWKGLAATTVVTPESSLETDPAVSVCSPPLRPSSERKGGWLYERVCELDLEGIVAKHGASVYQDARSRDMWIKIKTPAYSQKERRHEWFDRLRKKAKA